MHVGTASIAAAMHTAIRTLLLLALVLAHACLAAAAAGDVDVDVGDAVSPPIHTHLLSGPPLAQPFCSVDPDSSAVTTPHSHSQPHAEAEAEADAADATTINNMHQQVKLPSLPTSNKHVDGSPGSLQLFDLLPGSLVSSSVDRSFELIERVHLIGRGATNRKATTKETQMEKWHSTEATSTSTAAAPSHPSPSSFSSRHALATRSISSFPVDSVLHHLLALTPELAAPPGAIEHDEHVFTATVRHQPLSEGAHGSASTTNGPSGESYTASANRKDHEYELRSRVGRGHFGELWRARRVGDSVGLEVDYILKRLFVEKGMSTLLSGRREVHFGLKLQGTPGVARLIEWFEEGGALWLVFLDEGVSLERWLTESVGGVVKPSHNWSRMKIQMKANERKGDTSRDSKEHFARESIDDEDSGVAVSTETSVGGHATTHHTDMFGPFLPSPTPSTVATLTTNARIDKSDTAVVVGGSLADLQVDHGLAAELPTPPGFATHQSPPLSRASSDQVVPRFTAGDFIPSSSSSSSSSGSPVVGSFLDSDLKSILFQLLTALSHMHAAGITHRDVKPANILLRERKRATSRTANAGESTGRIEHEFELRLCDLGSSIDADETIHQLLYPPGYESSVSESTLAYAPPEVLFSSLSTLASTVTSPAYDVWSVGVIALEMIIGSNDNIWTIDQRVRARIERKVEEAFEQERRRREAERNTNPNDADDESTTAEERRRAIADELKQRKEKAVLFRAFVEYGIYDPTGVMSSPDFDSACSTPHSDPHTSASDDAPYDDGDARFERLLKQRDPMNIGANNKWLIKLIRVRNVTTPDERV